MALSKMSLHKIDCLMQLKVLHKTYKVINIKLRKPKKQYYRRWWVRPTNRKRHIFGLHTMIDTMRNCDEDEFFSFTRMSVGTFDELVSLIRGHLQKKSRRPSIPPDMRLYITLRPVEMYSFLNINPNLYCSL